MEENKSPEHPDLYAEQPGDLTDAEIVSRVSELGARTGKRPSQQDIYDHLNISPGLISSRFSGLGDLLKRAGYRPRRSGQPEAPKTELVEDVQRVAKHIGRSPTRTDYKKHGEYHPDTIYKRIGRWSAVLEAAGLDADEVMSSGPHTRQSLAYDIQRVDERVEQDLTSEKYKEYGLFTVEQIEDEFGSWKEAIASVLGVEV